MANKAKLIESLRNVYFWDLDRSDPDSEVSDRLVIDRIFSLGDLKEIRLIIDHYGEKKIVEVLSRLNYLDPKTLNFVSKLFNRPKKQFRCYTRKLSITKHWN